MTTEEINALSQVASSFESEGVQKNLLATAMRKAVELAEKGYQSDQQAIADEVTKQVGDVQDENGTLKDQVDSLLADNDKKDAQIGDLQAYKDEHSDIQIA